MTDIATAAQQLVDRLTAGGVRAAVDARDLNPPCVQVRPPSPITWRFGKGWEATWELWAIVPDPGQTQAFKALGELIDQVQAALNFQVTTGRPDVVLTGEGATLPAYVLTLTTTHRK